MKPSVFNKNLEVVLDRTSDISELVEQTLDHWGYDLQARRPGPAYTNVDGSRVFTGQHDLELACFLSALISRRARIKFPVYKSRTGATKTEGTVRTGSPQGRILAMIGNGTKPSFSIRIEDQSVTVSGEHTASGFDEARVSNLMLQDYDGTWASTWKSIEFLPAEKENDFLEKNDLWSGNVVNFSHFIHPNRWTGAYGRYYVLAKVLLERMTEEYKFVNAEFKRIIEAGHALPNEEQHSWPKSTKVGTEVSIKVPTIEAQVTHPDFNGEYVAYETSVKGVQAAHARKKTLRADKEKVQFHVRATEFAFLAHGHKDGDVRYPSWIKERFADHKIKRTTWKRLPFSTLETKDSDGNVSEGEVAFLYRAKQVSVQVAEKSVTSKDEVVEGSRTSV